MYNPYYLHMPTFYTASSFLWDRPIVASKREWDRGDRTAGMATSQAQLVHAGMAYDVEVDTSETSPVECAHRIAQMIDD